MNFSLFHNTKRICNNCGMSVPEGNMFCEACGAKYESVAESAKKKDSTSGRMYCPNGHQTNDDGSLFCVECGTLLIEREEIEISESPAVGWTCSCGGTNDADSMFCTSCGQHKPGEGISVEKPVSGWICSCGGTNDEESMFCVSCGNRRMPEPKTMPKVTESEKPVIENPVIPNPKPNRDIPAIPDIMRPLTNNDMMK